MQYSPYNTVLTPTIVIIMPKNLVSISLKMNPFENLKAIMLIYASIIILSYHHYTIIYTSAV